MPPWMGPGSAVLSIVDVPILANSGHCASSSVSNASSESAHAVLPFAPLAARENPFGRVVSTLRISEGEGAVGLWVWGTLRVTSSPDAVSAALVVAVAFKLGSKVSLSQPVVAGQGEKAVKKAPV